MSDPSITREPGQDADAKSPEPSVGPAACGANGSNLASFCGLSKRQSTIVSWGITSLAICLIALLVTLITVLGNKTIKILAPAISPLIIGLFLSFVLCGLFKFIRTEIPNRIREFFRWEAFAPYKKSIKSMFKWIFMPFKWIFMPFKLLLRLLFGANQVDSKINGIIAGLREWVAGLGDFCTFLIILLIILGGTYLLTAQLGDGLGNGINALADKDWPKAYESTMATLKEKMPFITKVNDWLGASSAATDTAPSYLLEFVKNNFMHFIQILITGLKYISQLNTWLFAVFFCYCFLSHPLSGEKVTSQMKELQSVFNLSDETWSFVSRQVNEFKNIMTIYFPKQIIINLLEGLLGGILLMYLGLPCGFPLGFLMGFMNIVPLFGTFLMLPIVLVVAYCADVRIGDNIVDSATITWLALGIWALVSLCIDQILPHILHGKSMKLSSGAIVFSFLFWGALIDPVWGMILAIPLSAFARGFRASIQEFIRKKANRSARGR